MPCLATLAISTNCQGCPATGEGGTPCTGTVGTTPFDGWICQDSQGHLTLCLPSGVTLSPGVSIVFTWGGDGPNAGAVDAGKALDGGGGDWQYCRQTFTPADPGGQ